MYAGVWSLLVDECIINSNTEHTILSYHYQYYYTFSRTLIITILFPSPITVRHPLTFTGHVHAYERTFPVLSGEVSTEQGVVYLTIGAGGVRSDLLIF